MKRIEHILYYLEELKLPIDTELSPEDWKDWYHYILFDPANAIRLLFNVSFSGRPGRGELAVTVQLTLPEAQHPGRLAHFGFLKILAWEAPPEARLPLRLSLPGLLDMELSARRVEVTVRQPQRPFTLHFRGRPAATPVLIPELFPYGDGFIGWGLIPGMELEGALHCNGRRYAITRDWFCYHDHNYGRFRWGDPDVGWVWCVAAGRDATGRRLAVVFHRGNNKDFSRIGRPYLFLYLDGELVKTFLGETVDLQFFWTAAPERLPILPGALASVFSYRKVHAPTRLEISARDDADELSVVMAVEARSEIILPDYQDKQYTFLKELNGSVRAAFRLRGQTGACENGSFYAEYVH